MPLPKETLKAYFIRDKLFLKSLFEGPNSLKNRRLILSANEGEIDTLIKYLHYLANGKIRIGAENFSNVRRSRKLTHLRKEFESETKISDLLLADDINKRAILLKLSTSYPDLLAPLFVLPKRKTKQ